LDLGILISSLLISGINR